MMGYDKAKDYLAFVLTSGKIIRTKDCIFNPPVFPLKRQIDISRHQNITMTPAASMNSDDSKNSSSSDDKISDKDSTDTSSDDKSDTSKESSSDSEDSSDIPAESNSDSEDSNHVHDPPVSAPTASTKRQNKSWDDHGPAAASKSGQSARSLRHIQRELKRANLSYSLSLVSGAEPVDYEEAITCEDAGHWLTGSMPLILKIHRF